jgi:hypothetical protein
LISKNKDTIAIDRIGMVAATNTGINISKPTDTWSNQESSSQECCPRFAVLKQPNNVVHAYASAINARARHARLKCA